MSYHTNLVTISQGNISRTIASTANVAGSHAVDSGSAWVNSVSAWAIGSAETIGRNLSNTTASTAGTTVQRSPMDVIGGTAWDSDDSVSRTWEYGWQVIPSSAATISGILKLMHRLDGGSWTKSASTVVELGSLNALYITSTNQFTSAGSFQFWGNGDRNTGLGATHSLRGYNVDVPIAIINAGLTDAADAVVCATCYDRNAASITNAATIRIHSWGWTNNANAWTELASVRADGSMHLTGPLYLPSYNVAGAPSAGTAGRLAYITDGDGGSACIGVDNGSDWKVVSLGATISAT